MLSNLDRVALFEDLFFSDFQEFLLELEASVLVDLKLEESVLEMVE